MSEQKSESNDGPSWLVYVIAGFAWQGLKTLAAKPHLVSGRQSTSVTNRLAVQGGKTLPKYLPPAAQDQTASAERSGNQQVVIPTSQHTQLRDSLGADQRTVNFDWALGEVKNQETEGACTAFAISSAVEMILKSRYQIDASVDAPRFWASYRQPSLERAIASASRGDGSLYATVKSSSKLHPFAAGTQLRIKIKESDFETLNMSQIAFALSEKKPIILSSAIAQESFSRDARGSGLIYAQRLSTTDGHAWLMSGVSRGLKMKGDVWFHMRNSWGSEWGQGGNAYLNALHCVLNPCGFLSIKNVSLKVVQPNPAERLMALNAPELAPDAESELESVQDSSSDESSGDDL